MSTCRKCGVDVGPVFVCGEAGFIDFPDTCGPCSNKDLLAKAKRMYRVWELSGLSDEEAAKLIDPPWTSERNSIKGWFNECRSRGTPLHSLADVMLDAESYGKAIGKLIAVARERKQDKPPPSNVVPFHR